MLWLRSMQAVAESMMRQRAGRGMQAVAESMMRQKQAGVCKLWLSMTRQREGRSMHAVAEHDEAKRGQRYAR